jgi:7,8-dihydropterin-6-yl-methyl-4-(beta-D-ribofuranosyl)aminobenzene 5'-phosphate synthase
MFVKILYDNKGRRGFKTGHGFSCLVKGEVLFDAGADAESLLHNMSRMKVTIGKIKAIAISHEHWDHTGGLWEILRKKRRCMVYGCPKFSSEFKRCVKEVGGNLTLADVLLEIDKGISITGELGAQFKGKYLPEQALVVKGKKGVSVITGCAHPGIIRILKNVKKKFDVDKIYMVLGGFHLGGLDRSKIDKLIKEFKDLGVEKVGPAHCTGDKAERIFKGKYGKNFIQVKSGSVIEL